MFYIHLSCSRYGHLISSRHFTEPLAATVKNSKFIEEFKLLFFKLLTVDFCAGFLHFLVEELDLDGIIRPANIFHSCINQDFLQAVDLGLKGILVDRIRLQIWSI